MTDTSKDLLDISNMKIARQLWEDVMPILIPVPPTQTFFTWVTGHPMEIVQSAIAQTAKKMSLNIYQGKQVENDSAYRYCSSILGHMASAYRRAQYQKRMDELTNSARGKNVGETHEIFDPATN